MKFRNTDMDEFKKIIQYKKIVCYGAGGTLREFCLLYHFLEIQDKIIYIMDGNEDKNGTFYELMKTKIPVISVQDFLEKKEKNYVILLSCLNADEPYEKLNRIQAMEEVECFYTEFLKFQTKEKEERNRIYPSDYRISDIQKIPKKIHYCWFGGKPIPEKNRIWMESWKKYCPDYEIIEWNEANYDVGKCAFMRQAYDAKAWGFVPDYARLDIIYHYGGIYLDIDVEIIKNPDDLLYQDGFCGIDCSKKISLGLGFGAVKGSHLLKELLNVYETLRFDAREKTASPTFESNIYKQFGYVENGNLQCIDGMTVYPEKVLSGKDNGVGLISATSETFFIHHYDASWCSEEQIASRDRMHLFYKMISQEEGKQYNGA